MKKWENDFMQGLVILGLTLAALIYSTSLEKSWITDFLARPDIYMVLALSILALLALLLVIRALWQRRTDAGQERAVSIWTTIPIWTASILFAYILLLDKLGFVLDSVWMLWVLTFLYSNRKEGRNRRDRGAIVKEMVKTGLFAIVSSLAVYLVFTKILSTRLPTFDLF